jgi:hypothetical protein
MATRDTIKKELAELVYNGRMLHFRELAVGSSKELLQEVANQWVTGTRQPVQSDLTPEQKAEIKKIAIKPNFGSEYQAWFSPALRAIEQLAHDRYAEFQELYKPARRKQLDIESYGIADYIMGITVTRGFGSEPVFNIHSIAMTKMNQQVAILASIADRLGLLLNDIQLAIQASVLDDEIASARSLLTNRHIRAAGVIAGVALEGHLKQLIRDHKVPFRLKAMLSNLNEALKNAGVYDVPQWREIQLLTDIRNLCGHKGEREPQQSEVENLISSTDRIVHTVF